MFGSNGERELVERMKQGDRKAMRATYDRHAGYLTAVCSRYVLNTEDVRDILQECFIKIFSSINRFEWREGASLRSWMTRIVVNESLKFLQQKERLHLIDTGDVPEELSEEEVDTSELSFDSLLSLIRQLPPGYRAVFNLFVFEEKSHKEIAEILGIKENTSASQYHRAKSLLAKKIKHLNTTTT